MNASSAIGCLEVFADLGVRVPEDAPVAGFDDTLATCIVVLQFTTIRQPLATMGSRPVELLFEHIAHSCGAAEPPGPIVHPVELVRRAPVEPANPIPALL